MTLKIRITALAAAALLVGSCADDPPTPDTRALSRDLLAQPVSDGRTTPVTGDPALSGQEARVPVSEVGVNRGLVEAPVKVVEMSDYGCGYCRKFHEETFPTLMKEFVDAGKVEWKFVPFITGMFDNSLAATEAAECTLAQDEAAFERINDRLWEQQAAWKGSDAPESVVRGWADELGIDMMAFDRCVERDERLPRIASATTLAQQLGVRGTPTFVVVGYPPLQGALPLDTFREVLTAVYERAREQGGP